MNNTYIESCPLGFLDKSELNWFSFNDIMKEPNKFSQKFFKKLYLSINKFNK